MKRLISTVIIISLVISVFPLFAFPSSAAMPSVDSLGGYQNLSLAYTFFTNGTDYGRQTVDGFMPLTGYKNADGQIVDYFFDSFLFLPANATGPSGASMHCDADNPNFATDWTAYVDDTFVTGKNVDALDIAFGKTKEALNDTSDKKAGVFFSILYPNTAATNFGELGGRSLNLSKKSDRKYAIKWIIDEQIKRYTDKGYENLELVGFYWLEEYFNINADYDLFVYAADYLHSKGLKFIWIPFFKARAYAQWKNMKFDVACMQPNNYWEETSIDGRVQTCADLCNRYGMGMEIELDSRAYKSGEHFRRYLEYLEVGMNSGAMNSIKMYYQDANPSVFSFMGNSKEEIPRYLYDITYKYAKGTLTQSDLNYDLSKEIEFTLPDDVEWISYGKNYTATEPYVGDASVGYQQVSGKELTDGVIGISDLGSEWHPFYSTYTDGQGNMGATIDLGKVYDNITHFIVHFSNIQNYGIGNPTNVRLYISTDGVNFESISNPTIEAAGIASYVSYVSHELLSARYVKVLFNKSSLGPFVFCSEFLVGKGTPANKPPVVDLPVEDDTGEEDSGTDSGNTDSGNTDSGTTNPDDNDSGNTDSGNNSSGDNDSGNDTNTNAHTHVFTSPTCENGKKCTICNLVVSAPLGHIAGAWVQNDIVLEVRCVRCNKILLSKPVETDDILIGDVNNSGEIDSLDYILVKRNYFGTYKFDDLMFERGDVNENGNIDTLDYILLKRAYFGTYQIS